MPHQQIKIDKLQEQEYWGLGHLRRAYIGECWKPR